MKEEQAIERIKRALIYRVGAGGSDELDHSTIEDCAALAWNEIKAIARETPSNPVPAWRTDMTLEQARNELIRGMLAEGQNTRPNPVRPNDSGNGWL